MLFPIGKERNYLGPNQTNILPIVIKSTSQPIRKSVPKIPEFIKRASILFEETLT